MSAKPPIRISVQIYEDDDPALYARLEKLPNSNIRRREQIVRLLRAGHHIEAGGLRPSSTGDVPAQPVVTAAATQVSQPVQSAPTGAPSHSEPPALEAPPAEVTIPSEDLATVFG